MALAPLATVEQVGLVLQADLAADDPSAAFLIAWASAAIRRYTEQDITASTVTELCTPQAGTVFLSKGPVNAVTLVETLDPRTGIWSTADPSTWRANLRLGIVTPNTAGTWFATQWPTVDESWRVTYSAGADTVPDDVAGVCANLVARLYATPVGIDLERNGMRQTKYSLVNDVLNSIELITLDAIRDGRLA